MTQAKRCVGAFLVLAMILSIAPMAFAQATGGSAILYNSAGEPISPEGLPVVPKLEESSGAFVPGQGQTGDAQQTPPGEDNPEETPPGEDAPEDGANADDADKSAADEGADDKEAALGEKSSKMQVSTMAATSAQLTSTGYRTATVQTGIAGGRTSLYAQQSMGSTVITTYGNDTSVRVYEEGSQLSLVTVGSNAGYMLTSHLRYDAAETAASGYAYVIVPQGATTLPLYQQATASSTKLGNYGQNTRVELLRHGSTFTQVRVDGKTGYMQTQYLSATQTQAGTAGGYSAYAVSTQAGAYVTVYTQPTVASGQSVRLAHGDPVWVQSSSNGWAYVTANGKVGYLPLTQLSTTPPAKQSFTYAYVVAPSGSTFLGLYETASTGSRVLDVYSANTQVKVYSQSGSFAYVEVGGRTGYMLTQYLSATQSQAGGVTGGTTAYVVMPPMALYVPLYAEASANSRESGQLSNGTQVSVISTAGSWSYVLTGGKYGYVLSSMLSTYGSQTSQYTTAYVVAPPGSTYLSLHESASTASRVLDVYAANTQVKVYGQSGSFAYVEVGSRKGYMLSQYLSATQGQAGGVTGGTTAYVVTPPMALYVPLYAEASANSRENGQLSSGAQVSVISTTGGWSYVLTGGKYGYVLSSMLSTYGSQTPQGYTNAYVVAPPGSTYLSLHETASTGSRVLDVYAADTQVKVYGQSGSFAYVEVGTRKGYMLSQYLSATKGGGTGTGSFTYGYVTSLYASNWIPMYAQATAYSSQLGTYQSGTQVKIYGQTGSWSYVDIGGKLGYMESQFITASGTGGTTPGSGAYATVNVPVGSVAVHLYAQQNTGSTRLATYGDGKRVQVTEQGSTWHKVLADGMTGYMQASGLRLDGEDYTGSTVYVYASVPTGAASVPMYAQTSTSSLQIASYANGTQLRLLYQTGSWSFVQAGSNQGYMLSSHLTSNSQGNTSYATSATVNNPDPSDRLNLRASATMSSTSLGRYSNGTQVKVTQYGSEWCRVEVAGKSGYMMTRYLAFSGGTGNPGSGYPGGGTGSGGTGSGGTGTTAGYATVKNKNASSLLHLRERASTASRSLGLYPNGTQVTLLSYGASWCQVQVAGKTGYMATSNLSVTQGSGSGGSGSGEQTFKTAYVNTAALLMYTYPDIYSKGIRSYARSTRVDILSFGSEWCYVQIDGQRGYMLSAYLAMQN